MGLLIEEKKFCSQAINYPCALLLPHLHNISLRVGFQP